MISYDIYKIFKDVKCDSVECDGCSGYREFTDTVPYGNSVVDAQTECYCEGRAEFCNQVDEIIDQINEMQESYGNLMPYLREVK